MDAIDLITSLLHDPDQPPPKDRLIKLFSKKAIIGITDTLSDHSLTFKSDGRGTYSIHDGFMTANMTPANKTRQKRFNRAWIVATSDSMTGNKLIDDRDWMLQ